MTASNMIEIPKELFNRMVLGLELLTKELLEELDDPLLLEDAQQWTPVTGKPNHPRPGYDTPMFGGKP